MTGAWLPRGTHHGIYIDHKPTGRGGVLVPGANQRGVIHTTQGDGFAIMSRVLIEKGAESHLLFGRKADGSFRARQFIPFTLGSRSLEHPNPSVTPPTNNAVCAQIEVCGFAPDDHGHPDWTDTEYDALSILLLMVEHHTGVPRKFPRNFRTTPHRYSPTGFLQVQGWVGHQHVPNQPSDHWDPGHIHRNHLLDRMNHNARMVIG